MTLGLDNREGYRACVLGSLENKSNVTAQVASELCSWQGGTALVPNRHEMGILRLSARIHGGFGRLGSRIELSSYVCRTVSSFGCALRFCVRTGRHALIGGHEPHARKKFKLFYACYPENVRIYVGLEAPDPSLPSACGRGDLIVRFESSSRRRVFVRSANEQLFWRFPGPNLGFTLM